jgi:N-carbamoylputrescine amidase
VVLNCPLGQVETNLERMEDLSADAARQGAAIICFPELSLTGYGLGDELAAVAQPVPGAVSRRLGESARRLSVVILAGLAEKAADGRVFAAHLVATSAGLAGVYRKIHVAPPERPVLSAGKRPDIFDAGGVRFGVQLCYDAHFPELSTRMGLEGADILFMPHASPHGTPEGKIDSWLRHLSARAFDNGVFVAACNQAGQNGCGLEFPGAALVIDPSGTVLERGVFAGEGILTVDLKAAELKAVREHRMRYFLPHRRPEVYRL